MIGAAWTIGVLVNAVYPDGPADRAGIEVGDIIEAVGRREVLDPEGLAFRIATRPLDSNVELTVLRGGEAFRTEVVLEPPPETPRRNLTWIEGKGPLAGARVGNLSPAFAEELGLDPMRRGVVVAEVAPRGPARNLGLKPGDTLARINDREIRLVDDVLAATNEEASTWRITIGRGDRRLKVVIGQ